MNVRQIMGDVILMQFVQTHKEVLGVLVEMDMKEMELNVLVSF